MSSRVIAPSQTSDGWAHIKLDHNAWYVRLYLWLYDADPLNINTCKLFWAYLFAPLALLFRGLAWPVVKAGTWAGSKLPVREPVRYGTPAWEANYHARKAKASAREARLDKWSHRFGMFWLKVAPLLRWVGIALGVAVGVAGVVGLVYVAITHPIDLLKVLAFAAGFAAVSAAGVALLVLLIEKSPFFSLLAALGKSFHRHTCAKIEIDSDSRA